MTFQDIQGANAYLIPSKPEQSQLLDDVLTFTENNPSSFVYTPSLNKWKYEDATLSITYFISSNIDSILIITDVNDAENTLTFKGKISNDLEKRLIRIRDIFEINKDEMIASNLIPLVP